MKITISNDEGEVYVIARPTSIREQGPIRVVDDEGDETRLDALVIDAAIWERQMKARKEAAR